MASPLWGLTSAPRPAAPPPPAPPAMMSWAWPKLADLGFQEDRCEGVPGGEVCGRCNMLSGTRKFSRGVVGGSSSSSSKSSPMSTAFGASFTLSRNLRARCLPVISVNFFRMARGLTPQLARCRNTPWAARASGGSLSAHAASKQMYGNVWSGKFTASNRPAKSWMRRTRPRMARLFSTALPSERPGCMPRSIMKVSNSAACSTLPRFRQRLMASPYAMSASYPLSSINSKYRVSWVRSSAFVHV
mmetsp:Transcript_116673/g.336994  ORF Transcript_116673/g.336994 Transcript_116673/m.336994 type:complete len:245 (+) Transcript_116673:616-1350(+)